MRLLNSPLFDTDEEEKPLWMFITEIVLTFIFSTDYVLHYYLAENKVDPLTNPNPIQSNSFLCTMLFIS